ncbi:putative protein phosphatase 2C 27 [Symbiodinium microadriaticum]|uniref:PPM-type phosphatase domain-containing protein n=1 Tax=Symbiodinium microadriaticum TaxID=2951 RepID=A0A1Q9DBE9_SYMMI|nr:putative protein phosphatase 2C 27 [Symbiodinium microadriaticum]
MSLPRQRDLLPLRLPDAERVWREGLGRGTRQRISRRLAADAWAREGAQTLNDLYGKAHVVSGVAAPVGTHAFALEHLRGRYQCVGPPPTSRPEEALTALLGSMSIYENDHFECKHASFDESKISWPEPGSSPVEIAELLTPDVGRLLKLDGVCELLADAGEKGLSETVRPYVDPVLANSPTKMGKFLTRLFDANMLSFKPGWEAATVGVFFVYKKNGSHRLILDTRAANQAFAKPRSSRLPTPAAWTSLELDSREVLYTATGDVADAFHRMRLPVHLRKYFRLPSIQCRFLERRLWPSGCSELDYVCPEYATLPMGWCWSLFFCQSLLENAAREAGLRDDDRIEDRSWAGQVSKGRLVHAEYVDNFFVSGTDADLVQRGFNRLRAVLEQWGFRIHDVSDAAPVVEGLGLLIDGNAGRISLTAKRIWKLQLASIALCRRRGAPLPKIVEKIIGHFTFAMLIRTCEAWRYKVAGAIKVMWSAASVAGRQFVVSTGPYESCPAVPRRKSTEERLLPKAPKRPADPASTVDILAGSQSHLELFKVRRTATQERYRRVLGTFLVRCEAYLPLTHNWDALLTAYLNELYAREENVSVAEYTFAAFKHRYPEFGKFGVQGLPRATQALEGYRNLAPPLMRLPTPRAAFIAIIGVLLAQRMITMAIALLLQWDLLLRPGELASLTVGQLVPPAGTADMCRWGVIVAPSEGGNGDPSKTNLYDEGITLSPMLDFLTEAIAELKAARLTSLMLFPFTCAQLAEQFKKAAARVGVAHLGATLYGNRHGGASDMRLRGVGLPEIKKRGRWAADSSLRRYEKATVAQQQHLKVPAQTRVYADFVETQLKQLGPMLRQAIRLPSEDNLAAVQRQEFKSDLCQYGAQWKRATKDVWHAYQWLQSDLVPLHMPRFGPVSGREDIVRGMLDRCGMLSRGIRGTVLSKGLSFTSLLPSRARILIMSSVADAESLSACEVFMLVLQAHLHVECAVVLNRKQMIRWKPFAYYLVVLLVRGIFNNHRFGQLLLTGLSAPGRSLELLTIVADPHFEFPSFDADSQMHDADDANAIMEENDPLIEAYRSLVSVLAMPFSPLGSEGLQQKQVAEIAGRMHRYKDPAKAAWRDDADDRGLEMDLDFEELACQQQSTMHSLSELPMEPLAFQAAKLQPDDGTASKFSIGRWLVLKPSRTDGRSMAPEESVPCEDFTTCGAAQFQNKSFPKNVKQQDSYFIVEDMVNTFGVRLGGQDRVALYGVADGHGECGEICAAFVRRHLPTQLARSQHFAEGQLESALVEAFVQTDLLQKSAGLPLWASGACVIAAAVSPTSIVVANCGDCRCVLAEQGTARDLSSDHNVQSATQEELRRVLAAGGSLTPDKRVTTGGAPGRLATTRSLGDYWAKPQGPAEGHIISGLPEIQTIVRRPGQQYLLMASDGIFGFMSSQEVVSMCLSRAQQLPSSPLSAVSHALVCAAVARRSDDNCTCLVVDLSRVELSSVPEQGKRQRPPVLEVPGPDLAEQVPYWKQKPDDYRRDGDVQHARFGHSLPTAEKSTPEGAHRARHADGPREDSEQTSLPPSSPATADEVCWCPWCCGMSQEGTPENLILGSFERWRLHMHEHHFDKLGLAYAADEIVPCYWCCRPCVTKKGQLKSGNRLPFWGSHERVCRENPSKPVLPGQARSSEGSQTSSGEWHWGRSQARRPGLRKDTSGVGATSPSLAYRDLRDSYDLRELRQSLPGAAVGGDEIGRMGYDARRPPHLPKGSAEHLSERRAPRPLEARRATAATERADAEEAVSANPVQDDFGGDPEEVMSDPGVLSEKVPLSGLRSAVSRRCDTSATKNPRVTNLCCEIRSPSMGRQVVSFELRRERLFEGVLATWRDSSSRWPAWPQAWPVLGPSFLLYSQRPRPLCAHALAALHGHQVPEHRMPAERRLYNRLGVPPNASPEDIKRLALKHHPDRGGDAKAFQGNALLQEVWGWGVEQCGLMLRSFLVILREFVTKQDILSLTVEDLPTHWSRISAGKARRHKQIQAITRQLDKTFFFMGFNKEKMLPNEMEEARSFFPPTVNVRHLNNNWLRKAMEGTKWEPMRDKVKGSNIYVFVETDKDLKPSIQAYMKIEKQFGRTAKLDVLREEWADDLTYDLQPMIGGMMSEEWNVMEPADVVKLKDFPTKTELIGQIAGSIKQVTTKLAVGVKQVPTKLAIGLKKTVEKGEEDGKSVRKPPSGGAMAGFSQSTPGKPRSAVESIMLLLAAGIGSGVMVLPRAMAAVGPGAMLVLFIGGWLISSVTTWILFSAVTEARRQPETIMSISSRLLSNSMSSHSLVGLISPQAARGLDTPTAREPHDPHALLSPTAATVLERKRSTSVYDFKDRKSSKQTARVVEQAHLPGPSYGDLLAMVWPPSYMTLLDLVLLVHQLLALTVYFLFISEFMAKLPLVSECPSPVVILILAVPASLLAQLESVGGLARLASISPFALLFMMFGVFYRYHYPDSGMAPSDFSTAEPDHEAIPSVMCVAVFSFMWHTNCVTVARELRDPSATRRLFVVLTATTVLLFAYTSLAYFGYETFGQELRKVPTIMMLYSGDDPIFMTVRVLLSCSLFVAIPLNVYPVRESILNQVRFHSSGACFEAAIQRQNYISICLVFVPAILAIVIPSVTAIITVIGGSLVTFLMIVFPVFISELVLPETAVLLLKFLALLVVPSLVAASFKLIGKPF